MEDNAVLLAWKSPFCRERHPEYSHHGRAVSTACGDEIDLDVDVVDGKIRAASFEGDGCVICLGMASLLTEHLVGQSVDDIRCMVEPDMLGLAGVVIDRRRRDCALVAFKALSAALRSS
jgi:nitrogen fixation NifU-like protein